MAPSTTSTSISTFLMSPGTLRVLEPPRQTNADLNTGNPGSVIVSHYGSSKITMFVLGKNTILKFLGNTK